MDQIREKVDVCVIGAGHAGCEAALACARMGLETVIFTVSVDSIALMPCNQRDAVHAHRKDDRGQHRADALQSEYRRFVQGTSGA